MSRRAVVRGVAVVLVGCLVSDPAIGRRGEGAPRQSDVLSLRPGALSPLRPFSEQALAAKLANVRPPPVDLWAPITHAWRSLPLRVEGDPNSLAQTFRPYREQTPLASRADAAIHSIISFMRWHKKYEPAKSHRASKITVGYDLLLIEEIVQTLNEVDPELAAIVDVMARSPFMRMFSQSTGLSVTDRERKIGFFGEHNERKLWIIVRRSLPASWDDTHSGVSPIQFEATGVHQESLRQVENFPSLMEHFAKSKIWSPLLQPTDEAVFEESDARREPRVDPIEVRDFLVASNPQLQAVTSKQIEAYPYICLITTDLAAELLWERFRDALQVERAEGDRYGLPHNWLEVTIDGRCFYISFSDDQFLFWKESALYALWRQPSFIQEYHARGYGRLVFEEIKDEGEFMRQHHLKRTAYRRYYSMDAERTSWGREVLRHTRELPHLPVETKVLKTNLRPLSDDFFTLTDWIQSYIYVVIDPERSSVIKSIHRQAVYRALVPHFGGIKDIRGIALEALLFSIRDSDGPFNRVEAETLRTVAEHLAALAGAVLAPMVHAAAENILSYASGVLEKSSGTLPLRTAA